MSKRKEPEVEFVDMIIMRSDGVVVAQRTQPEPKSLIVIGNGYRMDVDLETKSVSLKDRELDPPSPWKVFPPCKVCRRGDHAPNDPVLCWGYEPGSPNDPDFKPTVAERKHHGRIVRPPGYPPSPPNLPPSPPATKPLLPRSV
jgi:hypothetical protein